MQEESEENAKICLTFFAKVATLYLTILPSPPVGLRRRKGTLPGVREDFILFI